jgi:hypothetical protein
MVRSTSTRSTGEDERTSKKSQMDCQKASKPNTDQRHNAS